MLIERSELTSGSTWHAGGRFPHAELRPETSPSCQAYTVNLYKEDRGDFRPVLRAAPDRGLQLADTPERLDWLKMAHARGVPRHGDRDHRCQGSEAAAAANRRKVLVGAMWDPIEGHLDPYARPTPMRNRRGWRSADDRAPQSCAGAQSQRPTAHGTSVTEARDGACRAHRQCRRALGAARSAAWSAWSCRCSRWSTTTS